MIDPPDHEVWCKCSDCKAYVAYLSVRASLEGFAHYARQKRKPKPKKLSAKREERPPLGPGLPSVDPDDIIMSIRERYGWQTRIERKVVEPEPEIIPWRRSWSLWPTLYRKKKP